MHILLILFGVVGAALGFARLRPAPRADDPEPDDYSDEEREALLGLQRAHRQHVMRMAALRARGEERGEGE